MVSPRPVTLDDVLAMGLGGYGASPSSVFYRGTNVPEDPNAPGPRFKWPWQGSNYRPTAPVQRARQTGTFGQAAAGPVNVEPDAPAAPPAPNAVMAPGDADPTYLRQFLPRTFADRPDMPLPPAGMMPHGGMAGGPGAMSPAIAAAGRGRPQTPGEAEISAKANGGDVTSAIMQGAGAADDVANPTENALGEMSPAMAALTKALMEPDSDGKYGSYIDQVIQENMKAGDPSRNRGMALAKAGFTMAGSKNPYFFGALGEGGTAGLEDYQKSQQQDVENRVRAATLAEAAQRGEEAKRQNKIQGLQGAANLEESAKEHTQTFGLDKEKFAETKKQNERENAINVRQLAISAQNASVAQQQAQLAREEYENTAADVKRGAASTADLEAARVKSEEADTELKKQNAEWRKAQAASQAANVDTYNDAEGYQYTIDVNGQAQYITDPKTGAKVKGSTKVSAPKTAAEAATYKAQAAFDKAADKFATAMASGPAGIVDPDLYEQNYNYFQATHREEYMGTTASKPPAGTDVPSRGSRSGSGATTAPAGLPAGAKLIPGAKSATTGNPVYLLPDGTKISPSN